MSGSGDWLKLHRALAKSFVMSDDWLCRLWISCLLKTNWRVGYFRGVEIQPGQFAFSYRSWCDVLGVSKGKLSRGLKRLEAAHQIDVKAGRNFTVVTLCNWETYQDGKTVDGTPTGTPDGTPTGTPTGTRIDHDRRRKEGKKERRKELDAGASCTEPEKPARVPVDSVMEFPTTGSAKTWHLTATKVAEGQATFDTLDVVAECRKARQWIIDNPGRRKTARGMLKFLGGWLGRAVDSGRGTTSGPRRATAAVPDHSGLQEWFDEAEAADAPALPFDHAADFDGEVPF